MITDRMTFILAALTNAEENYLKERGWVPELGWRGDNPKDYIRLWKKGTLLKQHSEALAMQKREDRAECERLDRIAADLLPTKYCKGQRG